MYANIGTEMGIATIKDFLATNANKLSTSFPTKLFLQLLEYVMKYNIFLFGNTY